MTTTEAHERAATLFKALGNPQRLELLRLLSESPRSVGDLAEAAGLSQPLTSQHLKTLKGVAAVQSVREGRSVRYSLADHHIEHIVADALAHHGHHQDEEEHSHD